MTTPAGVPSGQEFSAKSVEDAIAEGLRRLGLRADQVDVEVLHRGSRGLFGLGSEPAVVRLTRRSGGPTAAQSVPEPAPSAASPAAIAPSHTAAPDEPAFRAEVPDPAAPANASTEPVVERAPLAEDAPVHRGPDPSTDGEVAEMASEMLAKMVELMGFTATVNAEWRDADAITDERHLLLSVDGSDLSPLIGRRGDTLENIQYLLRLMVNQRLHRWLNIIVDVEQYRAKRQDHLTHLALRMADQVAETGRSFALEPMPPNERRIVHLALRDHDLVYTESSGDGERRKVILFPKK